MPIFSSNRVGGTDVVANESYTDRDFGRVLYECAVNDNLAFNRALSFEFKEIEAMREGTMLSSEFRALQEVSLKDAWKTLKEKMKKLWEKIKGIFKQVTAKLAVWFVRYGKAYVALNKRLLSADVDGCTIPKYRKKSRDYEKATSDVLRHLGIVQDFTMYVDMSHGASRASTYNKEANTDFFLRKIFDKEVKLSNLQKELMDYAYDKESVNKKFGSLGVSVAELFDVISTGRKPIKDMKKAEREADKTIKGIIKELEKAEREAKSDSDYNVQNKAPQYNHAAKLCTTLQTLITAVTKAQIAVIKFDIKQSRAVVAKLAAYSPTNESSIFEESCWLEAAGDVDDEIESTDAADINDSDVCDDYDGKALVQIIVNGDDDE